MDDILSFLEETTHPESRGPEYRKLCQDEMVFVNKLQAAFSVRFLDDFFTVQAELEELVCREAFSRGFRLGVQLTLAGLQPFSS